MAGARSGGGGAPEASEMSWLAFVVVLAIVVLAVWFGARGVVVYPLLVWAKVNYFILDNIGFLDDQGRLWRGFAEQLWEALRAGRVRVADVSWGTHLYPLHRDVSQRSSWLWLAVCAVVTVGILFRSRGGGFRRVFSLTGQRKTSVVRFLGVPLRSKIAQGIAKTLAWVTFTRSLVLSERKEWQPAGPSFLSYQSQQWRTTAVAEQFRAQADNIPAPPLTPAEWVLRYVRTPDRPLRMSREEFVQACAQAMRAQLGPVWRGVRVAPAHVQALAALAYINRYKGEVASRRMADRLTNLYLSQTDKAKRDAVFRQAAHSVLSDTQAVARIEKWASIHAYVNTAMLGIYGRCGPFQEWGGGQAGVLPTSMFLWLKAIDRPLWYALNNVGRRAFHIEGAGAVCHFFHERLAQQALEEPQFEEAITGGGGDSQGRLHGILGYLHDNGMLPDKGDGGVDFSVIERVIKNNED